MVGLEEEIIDKDFRQSFWLALQFWVQPNRIFTAGVPQLSYGKSLTLDAWLLASEITLAALFCSLETLLKFSLSQLVQIELT